MTRAVRGPGPGRGTLPFEVDLVESTFLIEVDPQVYTPAGLVAVGLRQTGVQTTDSIVGTAPHEPDLRAMPCGGPTSSGARWVGSRSQRSPARAALTATSTAPTIDCIVISLSLSDMTSRSARVRMRRIAAMGRTQLEAFAGSHPSNRAAASAARG